MMDPKETDEMKAAREIGEAISEFRLEFMDSIREKIDAEVDKVVEEGFDPARGRGRGPLWAEGG
jgi:hypothetical protein